MAGQQPMLSFAKVVSGLDSSININNGIDSTTVNAQQQNHVASSSLNAQNGNISDLDKGIRGKSSSNNFKSKSEVRSDQGRRQSQRSGRNKRSGGGLKERRLTASVEAEVYELTESTAPAPPSVVVLAPAPLPAVNAWFKQPQKSIFYIKLFCLVVFKILFEFEFFLI